MKTLIALSGLPGCGKTTAAEFFKVRSIPVVSMGRVVEGMLKKENKEINEENEKEIRNNLRKEYGKEAIAEVVMPEVERFLKSSDTVVIEGLRSEEERLFFLKIFHSIKIIFIEAAKNYRYKRLRERKIRPLKLKEAEDRDKKEIELGLGKIRKFSDYTIINEGDKTDFYEKLKRILIKIKRDA